MYSILLDIRLDIDTMCNYRSYPIVPKETNKLKVGHQPSYLFTYHFQYKFICLSFHVQFS